MPKRNEPRTLCESCSVTIARNFDLICYNCKTSEEMSKILNDESYTQVQGPFTHIPGSVLTKLIDTINADDVRRKHLHLLLLPQIESLNISSSSLGLQIIEFLSERCKRLRRLDLSYLRNVGPSSFLRLMPNLTYLQDLDLQMTEIIDQILELVGTYCPDLRSLNINSSPISNQGLARLVFDEASQVSRCQKLVKLNVEETMVTAHGLSFLIQIVPKLRELVYSNTFQIFNIHDPNCVQLDTLGVDTAKFHLNQLTSTNEFLDPMVVDVAFALCPFVTNVTITNSFVENEILYKLMVLENLTHLRLTNSDCMTMDYHEGVLPILMTKGSRIISLLLANFTHVDIASIGELCPRLENLALSQINVYQELLVHKNDQFKNLTALEIWTDVSVESLGEMHFRQMLTTCPNIKNLLISGSSAFNDNLFMEILMRNEMKKLSRLTFDSCPCLSDLPLNMLFDSINDLTLVRVWSCHLIKKESEKHFIKRASEENCDLYFEWFP